MNKITLAEHKYIRILKLQAYKTLRDRLEFSLQGTDESVFTDIEQLIDLELISLEQELTSEERLLIFPHLLTESVVPQIALLDLLEVVSPSITNILKQD